MEKQLKKDCLDAIRALDKSFKAMDLPLIKSGRGQALIDKFKKEAADKKLSGVAFASTLCYFKDFFSRELMPGGITLSPEASKDWNRLLDLANSPELLAIIRPFTFTK